MKTRIKTLTLFSALLASAVIAGAQQPQQRPEGPGRKQAELKCPVCGRPCVNKVEIKRVLRWERHRRQVWQRIRARRRAYARQRFQGWHHGPPNQFYRNGPMGNEQPRLDRQARRNREPARMKSPRPRREQGPPQGTTKSAHRQFQRNLRKAMPFDINGDGKLSKAEKAARRAYHQALLEEKGRHPEHRPAPKSQPPAE